MPPTMPPICTKRIFQSRALEGKTRDRISRGATVFKDLSNLRTNNRKYKKTSEFDRKFVGIRSLNLGQEIGELTLSKTSLALKTGDARSYESRDTSQAH